MPTCKKCGRKPVHVPRGYSGNLKFIILCDQCRKENSNAEDVYTFTGLAERSHGVKVLS